MEGWPHMDRTRGKCSENFRIEVVASILPPFESKSWEMKNLSMHETAKHALDLPLLKVDSFADIFRKLSNFHASIRPYWSVRWCHAAASLLCIQCFLATPSRSVSFQWLKRSVARFSSLNRFHIDTLSFEEQAA